MDHYVCRSCGAAVVVDDCLCQPCREKAKQQPISVGDGHRASAALPSDAAKDSLRDQLLKAQGQVVDVTNDNTRFRIELHTILRHIYSNYPGWERRCRDRLCCLLGVPIEYEALTMWYYTTEPLADGSISAEPAASVPPSDAVAPHALPLTCPICGGEPSIYQHPLAPGVPLADSDQQCLRCGLRVVYWGDVVGQPPYQGKPRECDLGK